MRGQEKHRLGLEFPREMASPAGEWGEGGGGGGGGEGVVDRW